MLHQRRLLRTHRNEVSLQEMMNVETTQFCCFGTNLKNATILSVVFGVLRVMAIFLVWYQLRPDIHQTEGKTNFYLISFILQGCSIFLARITIAQ